MAHGPWVSLHLVLAEQSGVKSWSEALRENIMQPDRCRVVLRVVQQRQWQAQTDTDAWEEEGCCPSRLVLRTEPKSPVRPYRRPSCFTNAQELHQR